MHKGSPFDLQRRKPLRWVLIMLWGAVLATLALVIVRSEQPAQVLYQVAVLTGVVMATLWSRRGRTSAATVMALVSWVAWVMGGLVFPFSDLAPFLAVSYLFMPTVLVAGMFFGLGGSLICLVIVSMLFIGAFAARGGFSSFNLVAIDTYGAVVWSAAFIGAATIAILSWLGWRELVNLAERADENATAMQVDLQAAKSMVRESVVAATHVAGISAELVSKQTEINAGSGEIAAASDAVSTGVHQQVAEVRHASRSADLLGERADEIARVSRELDTAALVCVGQMQDTSAELEVLRDQLAAIGKAVATVDKIADRTQLLAINASIEASRAGEAGLGFAVLAQEIQSLAEQSASSAREIAALNGNVRLSLVPVRDRMDVVQQGVQDARAVIGQVKTLTKQQVAACETMRGAMDRIARVADQNAVATEDITLTATAQTTSVQGTLKGLDHLTQVSRTLQAAVAECAGSLDVVCPNIANCPIFGTFCRTDPDGAVLAKYCTGAYADCARKKLDDAGEVVPLALMPDGSLKQRE